MSGTISISIYHDFHLADDFSYISLKQKADEVLY